MNRISAALAVSAVSLASTVSAQPVVYEVGGFLTEAENLAFSVINGDPRFQAPEPGDLPLDFTGTFVIDTAGYTAQFSFNGSFSSPTRSYTFDITTPNLIDGLDILALGGAVEFDDVFDDFDFEAAFTSTTGVGTFSYRLPGAVPSNPPLDVSAVGVLTSAVRIGEPASPADLAHPFGVLDLADLNAFVNGFISTDSIADLNQDGVLDLGDVSAFVDSFTVGLP